MNLSPLPIQKFFDNAGRPLNGGLLFTYVAGTTTKLATYQNQAGTLNANPIVLNFRGEANVWLDQTLTYKFVLAPEGDTDPPTRPIWSVDNISAGITFASLTQQILGMILYPITNAENAAGVTPVNYWYQPGNWYRYGATGNGVTLDTTAVQNANKLNGYSLAYNGTYLVGAKIPLITQTTLIGENIQNTVLTGNGFADYLLEVGNAGGAHANVGVIERIQLSSNAPGCLGLLHMWMNVAGNPPSLWKIRNILFNPASPCPGLVIEEIWDSEWENLDFLNCTIGLKIRAKSQNSNNLYFQALTFEGCLSGSIDIAGGCGPIYISQGKIDNGAVGGQLAAAITLGTGYGDGHFPDELHLHHFSINGINAQYLIDSVGSLDLGDTVLLGGNGKAAAIFDHRAWFQLSSTSWTGATLPSMGPRIGVLDLARAVFIRAVPFNNLSTSAAVFSKIFPIRVLAGPVTISANSGPTGNTINVTTNATTANNDTYNGCYLVHNSTGTQASGQAGARRKIIESFSSGLMTIQGTWACTLDADWSIEYCAGHYTPIRADEVQLDQGMSLFAISASGCTISGTPTYQAAAGANYGTTTITLAGIAVSTDLTGLYLIDEITGEPFLIGYGSDGAGLIGVMYDRTATLNIAHSFSVVGGYAANIKQNGSSFEWTYAGKKKTALIATATSNGFDFENLPLWECGSTGEPVNLAYTPPIINTDASAGNEFVLTVTSGAACAMNAPVNLSIGQRLLYTIRNQSGGAIVPTWNAIFKMSAWVQPANLNSRSIEFRYNGTNLVEINRTPADVPN